MKTDTLTRQQNLTDALKRFADHIKNTSDGALLVEATIVEIIDEGVGEYSVEYFGNTFSAYSNNREITYSVGDNVYISVPERDFSKTKFIIGLSNPQETTFTNNNNQIIYNEVSNNLVTKNFGTISLCSYKTQRVDDQKISDYTSVNFAEIANNYNTFSFSCKVKTQLPIEQQNSGSYGLILRVPYEMISPNGQGGVDTTWVSYPLDTSNMLGNFYRFEEWTPQTIYFTVDPQYKISDTNIPTLSYYCSDFAQDLTKTEKDIFIKDISLYAVEAINTADESGYGLSLRASEGEYFGSYFSNTKTITPIFRYNGKQVKLSSDNAEVYWFKENVSIKGTSEDYSVYGGYGWQCLNSKTNIAMDSDGNKTFSWVTSNMTLSVPRTDIEISLRYKCVILYKDIRVSALITLKELDTTKSFELRAKDDNTVLIKDTGYAHLIATVYIENITNQEKYRNSILYSWMRYDKNNNYISDDENFFELVRLNEIVDGKYETEIKFPVNRIEDINYVYCSATFVDSSLKKKILGTRSIRLSTSTLYEYNLIIENDNIIYKYDVNGDSPAGTAYDGPSTSKVKEIAPLNYIIKKASGEEFTSEEYCYVWYEWKIPKNSLIIPINSSMEEDEDYYYIRGYDNTSHTNAILKYKIADRFNLAKAQAVPILQVTFKDKVLTEITNISFIKEGMNGTNGTAYAARLVAGGINASNSVPYGTLDAEGNAQKLKFIYNTTTPFVLKYYDYETKTIYNYNDRPRRIFPQVYRDSTLLTYGTDYTVQYSMFDPSFTNPCFLVNIGNIDAEGGVLLSLMTEPSTEEISCNILQAKITVQGGNTSISNAAQDIYIYYPIELTITNLDITIVPSIDGGFAEVMYASDGTNPAYDETAPFKLTNNQVLDLDEEYYTINWEAQNHITPHSSTSNVLEMAFKPDNKYDDGNSKNYVAVNVEFNRAKETEINNEIARFEAQNEEYRGIVDKAANTQRCLGLFAEHFIYNTWIERLNSVKPLLELQNSMVYNAENILTNIDELTYLFDTQEKSSSIKSICSTIVILKNDLYINAQRAIEKVKGLGHNDIDFEDLISLNIIPWDDSIRDTYIMLLTPLVGDSTALTLVLNIEVLLARINQFVNLYQEGYNEIRIPRKYSNDLSIYLSIIGGIQIATDYLSDGVIEPQYIDLREKILNYIPEFFKVVSYTDNKNIIDTIVTDVLGNTFMLSDGNFVVKPLINYYLTNTQTAFEGRILKNVDKIEALRNIIDAHNQKFFHIRPIITYFNRYEMSNINAWDGNKIDTGSNGDYLLAPQVGAGVKNQDNSFTGIVMGQRILGSNNRKVPGTPDNNQVGLFGYSSGVQSLFLNAKNGAAIFGVAGTGQIIIDPSSTNSLLYSSNYWTNYNKDGLPDGYNSNKSGHGMCIDLKNASIHFGDAFGKIYSGKHNILSPFFADENSYDGFYLSHDGLSIGSRVKITSDGVMKLGKGAVRGQGRYWTIDGGEENNEKYSYIAYGTQKFNTNDTSVYLGTDGISLGRNKFYVTNKGELTATYGSIAGWTITSISLSSEEDLQHSKTILEKDGTITCRNLIANVSGDIGGWKISSDKLESPHEEGSSNFTTLNKNGTITCWKLEANKEGSIGGWKINSNKLESPHNSGESYTELKSDGEIICWKLKANEQGEIGGWTINARNGDNPAYLTAGDTTLLGNGTIICSNLIASTSGTIGGWTIYGDQLRSNDNNTRLVGSTGHIICNYLEANVAGQIGGWYIGRVNEVNALFSGLGDITTDTVLFNNGVIYCKELNASIGGKIGNWNISSAGLSIGGTTLGSNGTITCSNLIANTSGSIGGWDIDNNKLSKGGYSIYYNDTVGMYIGANNPNGGTISLNNGSFNTISMNNDQGQRVVLTSIFTKTGTVRTVYGTDGHTVIGQVTI